MNTLNYINKLDQGELLKLLKPFIWGRFLQVLQIEKHKDSFDEYIEVTVQSECDDDESEGEKIILEDTFTLYDYDVTIWDYQADDRIELIKEYRSNLLNMFGEQYAIDYLLK